MTRQRLRNILTWGFALALMGYLFYTIPLDQLRAALAQTDLLYLLGVVLYVDLGSLMGDSWATARVASWTLAPTRFRELIPVRAATYLMAILNYNLGQAGLVYYLHRTKKVSVMAASSVILMMMGTMVLLLLCLSLAGTLLNPSEETRPYLPLLLVLLGGAVGYFVLLRLRPRFLAGHALLLPLFDAGVWGHLHATLLRIPHMGVVVTAHFLAMHGFGIQVPWGAGLVFIPTVLLIASLPITPFGLGTMQMAAIRFFSPHAPGATLAERQATVLAYSLSLATLALFFQAVMGLFFLRKVSRLIARPQGDPAGAARSEGDYQSSSE